MFAVSIGNLVASVVSRQLLGIAVWLVAVAGFPVAAGLGYRLVHHRGHEPIARRLYPLVASALVVVWAVGLAGLWFAVFMVALATGHAVG